MSKLKCVLHDRRVMVLPHPQYDDIGLVRHREDGSRCRGDLLWTWTGKKRQSVHADMVLRGHPYPGEVVTPAEQLLKDIFVDDEVS